MAGFLDDESEISSINITPLVDVVLVLLIIFMITAPALYQNALQVQLPKAQSSEGQTKGTLEVIIDAQGIIQVSGKTYELASFKALVQNSHPSAALILADKKVEHGHVISVIDLLKTNGVQKFSFAVERQPN